MKQIDTKTNIPPMTPIDEHDSNYIVIKKLGEGAMAQVQLAKHRRTGLMVALKVIRLTVHPIFKLALSEAEILRTLPPHPSVCQVLDCYMTRHSFVIVLEALATDLFSVLRRVCLCNEQSDAQAQASGIRPSAPRGAPVGIMKQILEALVHCHHHGVAHRDIKPENILLDSLDFSTANAKLCDFGLATRQDPAACTPDVLSGVDTFAGSLPYAAPEVLTQKGQCDHTKGDVWSAGVTLYTMVTGNMPWQHAAHADPVFARYISHPADFWLWTTRHSDTEITPDFVSLYEGMCHPDPAQRFTAAEALAQPFWSMVHNVVA